MGLEQVVYQSRATGSTSSLLNIAAILAESQRNNDRDGLTGVLAAHEGRFIQVLEGTSVAIDRLLRRLENDSRHRDLVILDRRAIDGRFFEDWAMASARIQPDQGDVLDAIMGAGSTDATLALLRGAVQPG